MSDDTATQRDHSEAARGDLQQLSALLLEAEPAFILDLQGKISEVNAAAQETYGLNRHQLLGRPFTTLVPPKWHKQIEDLLSRCLAGDSIRNVESKRQNLAGQVNPISISLACLKDESGNPTALAVHARDISELKLLEARLQRMTKVFMDAADPIIIRDRQGRIIEVNDEVQRTFGWSRDELVGKLTLTALPPESQARFEDIVQRCLRGEAVRNFEFEVPDKYGKRIAVLATASLLTGESGEPLGIAQVVKDISELKQTAQELQRSNRELEHFAAVVAHDLQQPLSTVKGYCDLLERHHHAEFSEQALAFLHSATSGIRQAQTLVGDLLSYACLDRQAKPAAPVMCSDAVNRALANLQSSIAEHGAEITFSDLPVVLCDSSQLVQLFENLLGNAIKYRGDESPKVEVSAEREGENWILCVADNGIGIDSAHHGQVFDIFSRLHPKDKYPGTGIGLAICRKIVERHGGRIWVESEPGSGSHFFFRLRAPENAKH
jgi:PAS domain S-box-containing protein